MVDVLFIYLSIGVFVGLISSILIAWKGEFDWEADCFFIFLGGIVAWPALLVIVAKELMSK